MPNFAAISQTVAEMWRFSNFQNGGRRQLGFSKCQNFRGGKGQDGQNAASCQRSSRSVKLFLRYGDLSFSIWRPSAVLNTFCACLDHPRRVFGGHYRYEKFGWNRCSMYICTILDFTRLAYSGLQNWRFCDFTP